MPVYDALVDAPLRHVLVRHEQAAAFAADGYARVSGEVGVCMATSGPGATNLVTGIANAYADSIPIVAITGQVPTALIGTDAFQEVDTVGITLPIVKHSFLVQRAGDIPDVVHEAMRIARSGRPGPVVIDLPKDVASSTAEAGPPGILRGEKEPSPPRGDFEKARALLAASKRPVLYAGGGIVLGRAVEAFRVFVGRTRAPVVATLKALGTIPTDHDLFLGMLGMHGTKAANLAVQEADLLFCIGARFDDRATGKLAEFAPRAKVVHADIDRAELGKRRSPDVPLLGNLSEILECMALSLDIEPWRARCRKRKARHAFRYDAPGNSVYAPRLIRDLSRAAGDDVVVTCDVGQHQMWVAQHFRFRHAFQHVTSGGLGAMGFGLPAAIGVQLARPAARVINVTGDGSFMMNVQELATLHRYQLPVKIVVLDNQGLGLVRQWQELFFAERYSEVDLSDNPDFARVALAFGIPAFTVRGRDEESSAIERLLTEPGPLLAHVLIDPKANVWPLVPPNRSNAEMLDENTDE